MSRIYQPRRASKKWLESAPDYVLAVYDMPGVFDRYTVLFGGKLWHPSMGGQVNYLSLSFNPDSPQGFSQWGDGSALDRPAFGKKIRWLDLPENVRQHIIRRVE